MKTIYSSSEPKSIVISGSSLRNIEDNLKGFNIDCLLSITDDYSGVEFKHSDLSSDYFETDGFISIVDPLNMQALYDTGSIDSLNFILLTDFVGDINMELVDSEGNLIDDEEIQLESYIQYQDLSNEWIDVVLSIPKTDFKVLDMDELVEELKLKKWDE